MEPVALQSWLLENPLWFGVVFFVGWIFVSFTFSQFTGWNRLAEKYRTQEKPQTRLLQAVQVSWGSFMFRGNIYTLGSTNKGLYLGVLFPFRVGHPPLLIPWRDIKARRVKRLLSENVELTFGSRLSRPFEISHKVAEQLRAESNGHFSF